MNYNKKEVIVFMVLTEEELVNYFMEVPGRASFVTFVSRTTPRMRKTDNPYWDSETKEWSIRKISKVLPPSLINFQYKNSVENQREREQGEDFEPFEPEPRSWGSRVDGTPLVEHKGRYYLEVKLEKRESRLVDLDGNEVPWKEVEEFLYSSSQPSTQKTEKEIKLRDFKLSSIEKINVFGDEIIVSS